MVEYYGDNRIYCNNLMEFKDINLIGPCQITNDSFSLSNVHYSLKTSFRINIKFSFDAINHECSIL